MTRAASLRRRLVDHYLTIDARSLGLGRIGLALVLLFDLLRRVPILTLFYSNQGLLPNHTLLWRPPTQWMFSFFFLASLPDEAAVCFILCGLVYLALLVGWRTRLMQFLALICVLSLHGRVTLLENGGDWMLGELALWTAFLPLGRRFSVDAVRASLRNHPETTAADLANRHTSDPGPVIAPELTAPEPIAMGSGELRSTEPIAGGAGPSQGPALRPSAGPSQDPDNNVVTLAAFALVLQLATSYFFNAIQKGGPTWRHGSAVHYVIYQNRMVTWFAVWMRGHMTLGLSRVMSYAALATESVLPVLLLSPFQRVWCRRVAIPAIIGLHLGFQCFINLGVFSWAMIGYTPFLLTAADWSLFGRIAARRGRRLVATFDAGCGVCFQIARVIARLDVFGRVRLISSAEIGPELPAVSPEIRSRTMIVVDEATGRQSTRADAVAQILRALPAGWLWFLPLRLPGFRQIANVATDAFARRRQTISRWMGLAACGVPAVPPPAPAPRPPFVLALRRLWALLREGAVLAMLIVLVSEALFINQAVPHFLKFEEPLWIKRLVAYPRLIQAWSMFASDAPLGDETVVVDAVTVDGRHVDPYSEVASRYPHPGADEIPERLDNNSFFFNYSVRIPDQVAYHQAFLEWILAYPRRTHHPNDRIVRFDAICVENDSPPPGQTRPHNLRRRTFLSYPPHR